MLMGFYSDIFPDEIHQGKEVMMQCASKRHYLLFCM